MTLLLKLCLIGFFCLKSYTSGINVKSHVYRYQVPKMANLTLFSDLIMLPVYSVMLQWNIRLENFLKISLETK